MAFELLSCPPNAPLPSPPLGGTRPPGEGGLEVEGRGLNCHRPPRPRAPPFLTDSAPACYISQTRRSSSFDVWGAHGLRTPRLQERKLPTVHQGGTDYFGGIPKQFKKVFPRGHSSTSLWHLHNNLKNGDGPKLRPPHKIEHIQAFVNRSAVFPRSANLGCSCCPTGGEGKEERGKG